MKARKLMNCNKNLHKSALRFCAVTLASLIVLTGCGSGLSGDENETDPVVVDNPVAYIKRPLQVDVADVTPPIALEDVDISMPSAFNPGAVLYLKDRASPTAPVRDLTSRVFSDPVFLNNLGQLEYDVKDLEVSYDGRKLLFAMRAPVRQDAPDDAPLPMWNIWEYDVDARALRQISADGLDDGDDIAPTYLPDGRILFSSTRQSRSKSILLTEGKPQYTAQAERRNDDNFVLHVMDADGTDPQQLTFNQSHDLDPIVMSDGTIVFSRWDNAGDTANNGMNLYRINPDGTGMTYLYGRHSHVDGTRRVQFVKPQEAENGNIVVQLREFLANATELQPTEVDFRNYVELNAPIVGAGSDGHYPVVGGLVNDDGLSMRGVYGSAFPFYDGSNRYLASWSPCLLVPADPLDGTAQLNCTQQRIDSGDYVAAAPHFGLWIVDANTDTQLPIEQDGGGGIQYDEAVLMNSRSIPDSYIPTEIDSDAAALALAGYGILHIRSVYDFDGEAITPDLATIADPVQTPPDSRAARFIRIEKPVSQPSSDVRNIDNSVFGRAGNQRMREILGYTPVEPDGSVKVAVPANVPFSISVLNVDGERETSRHENWLQVAPGETLSCNGCHSGGNLAPNQIPVPHGRLDAEPDSINAGAEPDSINAGAVTVGSPYPNSTATLVPDTLGDTMAETYSKIHGSRRLTPDLVYVDEWTNSAVATPGTAFSYAYTEATTPELAEDGSIIYSVYSVLKTDAVPITSGCEVAWTAQCRITINYPQHLHPLWSVDRRIFEDDGVTLVEDQTCTSCHTLEMDDGSGALVARVPAGQLDLTDGPSDQEPNHFKSYRELLFGDNEQELNANGILVDRLVGTGIFVPVPPVNGLPVLDADGNPVLVEQLTTVAVQATMNPGAGNSGRFLNRFGAGGLHEGYLSAAELKLIREWLDIGAQYFNNPYDPAVPLN